jgi:FtsH-binding integral membrane protein
MMQREGRSEACFCSNLRGLSDLFFLSFSHLNKINLFYLFFNFRDFTAMGGILFVGIIILFILAIFAIIFPSQVLVLVYASLGALLFCFYLVYDIQLMMGGKHKYSISPEEYIFAAINIYIDIINIFMYILMIIGAARN